MDLAMDEHALWADLDAVDPRDIQDYPPTVAWETSPGRYQAFWVVTGGMLGASWMGNENQRLTYYLGADVSGWDTTQLLRLPGHPNHKFIYWENGDRSVPGKLLWSNGRRYLPDEFEDLPHVEGVAHVTEVLEGEIDRIDRHEVWGRVRLKVSKRVRELVVSRTAIGDRSSVLWEIERELADAGCTVTEIVAVVRSTVWNKYQGRQDELKRLTIEASKAFESRTEATKQSIEEDLETKPDPVPLFTFLRNFKLPQQLIRGIWAEGSTGFIGGQPKSFKSWVALDMTLSVATGLPFLNQFIINRPGPVLYIQEEDPGATVKVRVEKMWPDKQADRIEHGDNGELVWMPAQEGGADPKVMAYIGQGFIISDAGWQSWLDEQLAKGFDGEPYRMVVMDPLMMIAGEVDEIRSQEMTQKVFKPLKQLARKHEAAVAMVHHMRKGDPAKPQRGGQLLLGSVANHAWGEDSLYFRLGRRGDVLVERESKLLPGGSFTLRNLRNQHWDPRVTDDKLDDGEDVEHEPRVDSSQQPTKKSRPASPNPRKVRRTSKSPSNSSKSRSSIEGLIEEGPRSTAEIAESLGLTRSGAYRKLTRLETQGKIRKEGPKWLLIQ